MSDSGIDARPVAGAFIAIALLVGVDVVTDLGAGTDWAHAAVELSVVALALGGAALVFLRGRRVEAALRSDLSRSRAEATRWREETREVLEGLSAAIDLQLERWELTPAEREVALLLLKGLSLKEIATVRGTSERTAREQARAIYRKGGLSGRSELSAFFLEDLLPPPARHS